MGKSTYYELLRHPNWQRMRLEVLDAHGFQCDWCRSKDNTLHVHHGYYAKGVKPWEYPLDSLHVLCEACHAVHQTILHETHAELGQLPVGDVMRVFGYILGLHAINAPDVPITVSARQVAEGIAAAMRLDADAVIDARNESDVVTGRQLVALKK